MKQRKSFTFKTGDEVPAPVCGSMRMTSPLPRMPLTTGCPDARATKARMGVNTIPGFTSISMYPMLWEASGLPLLFALKTLIPVFAVLMALQGAAQAIRAANTLRTR